MAVIEVTDDGLVLRELGPEATVEDVVKATEAELTIPDHVPRMKV